MTFEKDMEKIKDIVERLETGSLSLEESIALFKDASAIIKRCQNYLEESEMVVQKVVQDVEGVKMEEFT